jgi:CheY-like chemotaxis protein
MDHARQVSIFLVEDEALIRMMIAGMVQELGHRVVAEAGNIHDAQLLAQTAAFDLALLDVNV